MLYLPCTVRKNVYIWIRNNIITLFYALFNYAFTILFYYASWYSFPVFLWACLYVDDYNLMNIKFIKSDVENISQIAVTFCPRL